MIKHLEEKQLWYDGIHRCYIESQWRTVNRNTFIFPSQIYSMTVQYCRRLSVLPSHRGKWVLVLFIFNEDILFI
jgi:hypothetical protein